jgi:hypothetical protein
MVLEEVETRPWSLHRLYLLVSFEMFREPRSSSNRAQCKSITEGGIRIRAVYGRRCDVLVFSAFEGSLELWKIYVGDISLARFGTPKSAVRDATEERILSISPVSRFSLHGLSQR